MRAEYEEESSVATSYEVVRKTECLSRLLPENCLV